jgi:ATP-binding cassette subfamily C protein LapB
MTFKEQLFWALEMTAQLQSHALDRLRLQASLQPLSEADASAGGLKPLSLVCAGMGLDAPRMLDKPDPVLLPLVAFVPDIGWGVVVDRDPANRWVLRTSETEHSLSHEALMGRTAVLPPPRVRETPAGLGSAPGVKPSFKALVHSTLNRFRGHLLEAVLASLFIGALALATSLFSMQVYDRVIPTRSEYTLIILSAGVMLTVLIELGMKYARSHLMDHVIVGLDNRLSREIFQRLLQLRVDQLPASVGSLASQLRGYEQVRSFYTATTLFTLVDLPLGLFFLFVIFAIGSPLVAAVPAVFAVVAVAIGWQARKRVNKLAAEGARMSNMKTGLLVEAVEGVETIKAGSGGWKFLSRWISVNTQTIQNDLKMRSTTESMGYMSATVQQLSYAGLVVAGAITVMQGHMTMGALIACSILSGRILAPVMALPGLMVQHAHAKAAMDGLEKLYQLKTDHEGIDRPLVPSHIRGQYSFDNVQFAYGSDNPSSPNPAALSVAQLTIAPGERIGILGPIGSGKSTLLRLLSGLYHAQQGRILIDGLDITHVSREVLSRQVGYLQQDHRLFQGTLRENLLIGMPDPGDDVLQQVMERTGMSRLVANHPKGLERPIMEGGKGLSGGQRQLVAFTRLALARPDVLLLDEPTASMDNEQEGRCIAVLAQEANAGKTLIVVTHKPSLLPLVNRLIVVAGSRIVLDGPRDAVLEKLGAGNRSLASTTPQTNSSLEVTA